MKSLPLPSRHQQDILAELSRPGPHLVVHATAGAGKTTLLVQAALAQPPGTRQLFLAFARDAAAELKKRLPAGVETRTVHSLGRFVLAAALRQRGIRLLPPRQGKYRDLALELLKEQLPALATAEAARFLQELAGAARLHLLPAADPATLEQFIAETGLWPPAPPGELRGVLELLPLLLARGVREAEQGNIDFTDMIYVPVVNGLAVPAYDLVSVDEAQDYSRLALEFTLALAEAGARLVFVGDPRQSIFGFAGADRQALTRTADRLSARVLPLSVTWRCPRRHVELARLLAPEIEVAPGARGGSVAVIPEASLPAFARAGDLIICRLNAPLIGLCLKLLAGGHRAFIRGVDLRERLRQLAARVFRNGFDTPHERLRSFLSSELRRLEERGFGRDSPVAARLADEIRCLGHFLSSPAECADVETLITLLDAAFSRDGKTITLSSIHRAKGLEADRVVLLQPELLPAPYARSEAALEAEACVQFVALTRARRELVFTEPEGGLRPGVSPGVGGEDALAGPPVPAWNAVLGLVLTGRHGRAVGSSPPGGRRGRTRLFHS